MSDVRFPILNAMQDAAPAWTRGAFDARLAVKAEWDDTKHPRQPRGAKGGGEFAPKAQPITIYHTYRSGSNAVPTIDAARVKAGVFGLTQRWTGGDPWKPNEYGDNVLRLQVRRDAKIYTTGHQGDAVAELFPENFALMESWMNGEFDTPERMRTLDLKIANALRQRGYQVIHYNASEQYGDEWAVLDPSVIIHVTTREQAQKSYDESKHPRNPRGAKGGGQFAPKSTAAADVLSRQELSDLHAEAREMWNAWGRDHQDFWAQRAAQTGAESAFAYFADAYWRNNPETAAVPLTADEQKLFDDFYEASNFDETWTPPPSMIDGMFLSALLAKLTFEERNAIDGYADRGSQAINALARDGIDHPVVRALDSALAKFHTQAAGTVYSGVSRRTVEDIRALAHAGRTTFQNKAFVSTSLDRAVADRHHRDGYVLNINVPAGASALYIQDFKNANEVGYGESEFLLPRNSLFRIDAVGEKEATLTVLPTAPVTKAYDESKHPRKPRGRAGGGQFAPKAQGDVVALALRASGEKSATRVLYFSQGDGSDLDRNARFFTNTNANGTFESGKLRIELHDPDKQQRTVFERSMSSLPAYVRQALDKRYALLDARFRKPSLLVKTYDESKHPRNAKGSGRNAGRFAPRGGASAADFEEHNFKSSVGQWNDEARKVGFNELNAALLANALRVLDVSRERMHLVMQRAWELHKRITGSDKDDEGKTSLMAWAQLKPELPYILKLKMASAKHPPRVWWGGALDFILMRR